MSDPHSPWQGRSDDDPGQQGRHPSGESSPQPSNSGIIGSPPVCPSYGRQAPPHQQFSGPFPQYGGPDYGNAPFPAEQPTKTRNTVGIIALVIAILGAIISVVPGAAVIGWVLLPFGFILGVVGLFMSGKTKGTSIAAIIVSIVGTLVAIVFFITVVGSAFDDAFGTDVTVSQSDSGSPAAPAEFAGSSGSGEIGTRNNPSALGDVLANNTWELVVNSFNRNATDQVLAANMFNDSPPAGSQYALVNITATYIGADSGHANSLRAAFVTDSGNVIRSYDHPAVLPDPLEGELYTGASTTGNIGLAIPEGESGLLRLELGAFGDEVFVVVE